MGLTTEQKILTKAKELGFSLAQVAMRAGHDPAVASRHYTGRVSEADRLIADALSGLLEAPNPEVERDVSGFVPGF